MVQYWSHSRRSFRSSRARARFSTTLYIVQIRLTAPNLVQICEGIADGTSVTARRRSVLLQPSERHSPPSPVPAVPTACFPPRPQAKAMPTARLRPLARALHTALPFALRAKWARQCHAAEHDAFFAPPGIASPSTQNGCASAAPRSASPSSLRSGIASPTASLRGSAFVYFRRFPPLRNLQQPALRALFCIHVGIEKYPPPENFGAWGAVCTRAIPPSATLLRRRR